MKSTQHLKKKKRWASEDKLNKKNPKPKRRSVEVSLQQELGFLSLRNPI
jgi:hypothetical protein